MHYIVRRLLFYLVALWASITLNFIIPHLIPGNPAEAIFASHAQQLRGNPQALHTLETSLGLSTDPLPIQYVHYLINLTHGDLGTSFAFFPSHVTDIIMTSLPWTILLVGVASMIAFVVGVGLGTVVAWRRGGFLDTVLPPITILLGSFPVLLPGSVVALFAGLSVSRVPAQRRLYHGYRAQPLSELRR